MKPTVKSSAALRALAIGAGALWWRRNPSACPYGRRFWFKPPHPFITRRRLREILEPAPGEHLDHGQLDIFDVQQEMLDHTMRRATASGQVNLVPRRGDARELPYEDDTFDAAYLVAVLGEVPDSQKAMNELSRVLKPGGCRVVGELFGDPHWTRPRALTERAVAAGLSPGGRLGRAYGYFARFDRGVGSP